ncbi:hypothetical protein KBC99_02150 [Candidatus Saccharibacteria bacterium]|nr:hypothetical protein [Candidatus Saccharibacteria bacterium]
MKKALRFIPAVSALFVAGSQRALACTPELGIVGGLDCFTPGSGLTLPQAVQVVVNTLLFVVGISAVIVVIVAGLRYVLSSGNPQSIEGAKNQILYAIIGVVVSILAYAIVNFIVDQFK